MAIRVALHHKTSYHYDRLVGLSPHEVRLRPAPHTRTPILSYSLSVTPKQNFINWQQDPYGNYIGRFVFPDKTDKLEFTVDMVVDMVVINPFDFFVEKYAEHFPFAYTPQLTEELAPYLRLETSGPLQTQWVEDARREILTGATLTNDFLVKVNQRLQEDISYLLRMEPGVQEPDETLTKRSGSCRDTSWLLVQIFRQLGLAARFVSGYLIQLTADQKSLDGPSGPEADFTDLHAWTEVYIPGAGWIGLDPTSGMLASEGHIPLACTASPSSAAPVIGLADKADVVFTHEMKVTRIHEDPRVTKPYTEEQWKKIDALGQKIDKDLKRHDVRLTQGGEPTFVSIDDMDDPQWNTLAHGKEKRELAGKLFQRIKKHFAPGAMLHYGQGKWYPGEPLPRWALSMYWRTDNLSIWSDASIFSGDDVSEGYKATDAARFTDTLLNNLGLPIQAKIAAYEDVVSLALLEQNLPNNVDPIKMDLKAPEERRRLAHLLNKGLDKVVGYVVPIKPVDPALLKLKKKGATDAVWFTSRWPLKREHLYLIGGDSPMGLRLPLASLPWVLPKDMPYDFDVDPFAPFAPLKEVKPKAKTKAAAITSSAKKSTAKKSNVDIKAAELEVIHTALCVEVRGGRLYVFMPPVKRIEDYLTLLTAVEHTAQAEKLKLRIEGYPPPKDPRIKSLSVTPDPGVIEVNIHPSASWNELVYKTTTLYEEARLIRLGTEKFMLDGRHTGTGGGNHVTLGGVTPEDSPILRRPDLLKSLLTYWQNHPALSYLFSGTFIGPTSQAPRVDEARDDNLYELSIAFQQMDKILPTLKPGDKPWMVDRLLRNILVDLTGNTHRAEFSIDKLYSPDGPTGRLGILELRAFEMPPHERMSLLQMLLLRGLVARFWTKPYQNKLVHWGTTLHDRWMLPHFIAQDMRDIVKDLREFGYAFEENWFDPFIEFRFPRFGTVVYDGVELELRQAIEPWNVLGEEMAAGGTARYVDSSIERMQLRVRGLVSNRHIVTCNGRKIPLHPTGVAGEYVAGVKFRAWAPWSALHPTIPVQAPLVFDLVDTWNNKALGGCTYHVAHPGGRNEEQFPVNANAAEARRFSRFWSYGHTPGPVEIKDEELNPHFPMTLDMRWHCE